MIENKKHWSKMWYTDLVICCIGVALALSYTFTVDVYGNYMPSGIEAKAFHLMVLTLEEYGGKKLVICTVFGLSAIPLISAIRKLINIYR